LLGISVSSAVCLYEIGLEIVPAQPFAGYYIWASVGYFSCGLQNLWANLGVEIDFC